MPNRKRQIAPNVKPQTALKSSKSITAFVKDVGGVEVALKKTGRPRSEMSQEAILDAVSKLLLHSSVRDVSIEAIAKKAGVGKTTIYRWWPNKVAVILDSIVGKTQSVVEPVSHANPPERLVKHLERFVRLMKGRNGKIIAEILAEAQGDQETLDVFYQGFMGGYETELADIIDAGKSSKEFRSDLNTEMAVDMIYGALFYHLMSNHSTIDAGFTDRFVMEALHTVK